MHVHMEEVSDDGKVQRDHRFLKAPRALLNRDRLICFLVFVSCGVGNPNRRISAHTPDVMFSCRNNERSGDGRAAPVCVEHFLSSEIP